MSDTPPNPLEGLLSEFALGPAWARAKAEPTEKKYKDAGGEREYQPRGRRDDRQGGGRGRDTRGGDRFQGGGDRRQGGGNRRDDRGRPDFHREEIAPAEGVNVSLLPDKNAIQLVCKEVHQVARVYPLFDIAQIILAERGRSRATFEISEKQEPFLRCKIEEAIFLTKGEALAHLLAADWRDRFIEESIVEVDPPKGNFQSVAKCGISGVWLGPPNYHGYQTELRRLHRELFSSMPFEVYSGKVRTERSEEAVNEWLESMKRQTRWRILSDEEATTRAAEKAAAKVDSPPSSNASSAESGKNDEPPVEQAPIEEGEVPSLEDLPAEDTTAAAAPEETPAAIEENSSETPEEIPSELPQSEEETPAPAENVKAPEEKKWFTDRAEFERALTAEVLERAFHSTRKAKVSAAIQPKFLSPGLLVRLKSTGNHHKKHPAILIPAICKILEAEHMPVFKRKGKLFTGPARPHALAADAVLAPRPAQMVAWIRENAPAKLEGLWKAVLPEGATAPPAEYAADLFWLLQQGHILLYTDDILVVQEQPKPQEPKKPKKKKEKPAKVTPESTEEPSKATDKISEGTEESSEGTDKPSGHENEPSKNENEAAVQEDKPAAEAEDSSVKSVSEEKPAPEPLEILTEAAKHIAETVSETAAKIIEAATSSVAPEAPNPPTEEIPESAKEPSTDQ